MPEEFEEIDFGPHPMVESLPVGDADFDESKHPRDDRGRWVDVRGLGASALWVRKKIDEVADELGYPKEKIFMSDKNYSFELNGQNFKSAAIAFTGEDKDNVILGGLPQFDEHYEKGDIVLFGKPGFDQDFPVRGALAHEIEHQKFQSVLESLREEEIRSFSQKFPFDKLSESDGVSDYSRQYWEEWLHKPESNPITPVHETLAEISRLKMELSVPVDGLKIVDLIWRNLFKEVDKRYEELTHA